MGRGQPFGRGRLFEPAITTQELLDRSRWSLVQFFGASQQTEGNAKFFVQGFRVVADHIETTTFRRAFRPEGTYNNVPSAPNGAGYLANVGETIGCRGEEVKDSPVVPQIVGGGFKLNLRNVGGKPVDSSDALPNRFLFASMAVGEMSRTVMF